MSRATRHQRAQRFVQRSWLLTMALFGFVAIGIATIGIAGCAQDVIDRRPCKRDTDCKLDRICDSDLNACVFPLTRSPTDPSSGSGIDTSGSGGEGGNGATGIPCSDPSHCPGTDADCRYRICEDNTCGMENAPLDVHCDDDGGDSCNGQGLCVLTEFWTMLPATGAPTAREGHSAVWTGSEMIIWGGRDAAGNVLSDGARYDPKTDSWAAMSSAGAPNARHAHTAIWTGSEMVVWGGFSTDFEGTGSRYDPAADSWSAMSTNGAPSKRIDHTMVWTGSQVIIWGGRQNAPPALGNGARYNPTSDTWNGVSGAGKPSHRWGHVAVWTGNRMLIWGGFDFFDWFNNGAHYDPITNTWLTMGSTGPLPGIRMVSGAAWTGDRMLVWGGWDGGYYQSDGGQFKTTDGTAGTWLALGGENPPEGRAYHVTLWTGTAGLFVWGGCGTQTCQAHYGDGGLWKQNTWTPIEAIPELAPRRDHAGVYTGSEVIVWGGRNTNTDSTFGNGAKRPVK